VPGHPRSQPSRQGPRLQASPPEGPCQGGQAADGGAGPLFDEMPQWDALCWAASCWFIVRLASPVYHWSPCSMKLFLDMRALKARIAGLASNLSAEAGGKV
jgi:hypothetical protein